MKILDRMLLNTFLPVLLGSLLFSMLMLELVDLFQNLNKFINAGVSWSDIILVQFYQLPKTMGWSLPIALLFATSFSMGSLYARNELVAVFSAGISIKRFTLPLLVAGAILSVGFLFFEDAVTIPANKDKRVLTASLLGQYESFSQSNVSFISAKGRIVYNVVFFNFETKTLNSVTVIFRDEEGNLIKRVDAESADWADEVLTLRKTRIFNYNRETKTLFESWEENFHDPEMTEGSEIFEQRMTKLEDLSLAQAIPFLQGLEQSGLPSYRDALTDYYRRLSFAFTPFIVVLISSAVGGRMKKNILLMSLLVSLGISVAYYVLQMISGLLGRFGYIHPFFGSFFGVLVAGGVGVYLYHKART